jgi:hypothetical protein
VTLPSRSNTMSEFLSRDALAEMQAKYSELLSLRVAPGPGDDTRARMVALSTRFPGSLRELDDLELAELVRRSNALDGVLHHGAAVEPWMEALAMFHALARGALCVKRWLSGRKDVDEGLELAFARAVEGLSFPNDARRWQADLRRVASPPRGRMTDAVLALVARALETSERDARLLVFGVPRRERALTRSRA